MRIEQARVGLLDTRVEEQVIPVGRGQQSNAWYDDYNGQNGTGGLLVLFSKNIQNSGIIQSNGSNGGLTPQQNGGSSGGGSINVFYTDKLIEMGTIEAKGGASLDSRWLNG